MIFVDYFVLSYALEQSLLKEVLKHDVLVLKGMKRFLVEKNTSMN